MQTDLFDFTFDDALIATKPLDNRDDARLMVVDNNRLEHQHIHNLIDHFNSGDVLVLNNTKVIKARLEGVITTIDRDINRSHKCQITLHKLTHQASNVIHYSCFAKGSKKLDINDTLEFTASDQTILTATILKKDEAGQVHIAFNTALNHFFAFLDKAGTMPLPPYIEKYRKADQSDDENYQTVFAKHLGSVAAPTASLHLTQATFDALKAKNIHIAYVTLHVGGGTFLPVKSDDLESHIMHSEIIH